MDIIYIAIFSVTSIGIICAGALCIAAKFMGVSVDERLAKIEACLPGANCGACSYPGCSGYAKALLADPSVKTNLCSPGGAATAKMLSEMLGVEAGEIVRKIAVIHCLGSDTTQKKKMDYKGVQSCSAAKQIFNGEGACPFGCIGFGDCETVCPQNAICMEDSLARVIPAFCTGCGKCVKACPNKLISIENAGIAVSVLCKNLERGAVTRKKCSIGCIGCGKCARECPEKAITITDNLAVIDYEKCTGCGHCVEQCVSKCIKPNKPM